MKIIPSERFRVSCSFNNDDITSSLSVRFAAKFPFVVNVVLRPIDRHTYTR